MLAAAASAAPVPSVWLLIPLALLLLCIAAGPLVAPHFWHRRFPAVSAILGLIGASGYYLALHRVAPLLHAAEEYFGFIALIGALYVVAGGFHIRVKGQATPAVNALYLFIGAILANLIGTTGASMLLIRPWLRMNKYRVTAYHVVFFIFIVGNVGGCLAPIGDPPLFLGYLRGVPFWWVLEHCWPAWLCGVVSLLGIFYVIDRRNFARAPLEVRTRETAHEEWRCDGGHNLLFLAVILGGVFLPPGWREATMLGAALGSWFSTPRAVHHANGFDWFPLKEVAWLFAGIFAAMIPALEYLKHTRPSLGLRSPWQFYFLTGALSSVLDNAPTYLAFLATAFGGAGLDLEQAADFAPFVATRGDLLLAISVSSVFFGAMTYIGNGPNFMVKSIAQHLKVETPSFFGYLLRYSLPILAPVLVLVGWLFFSKWRLF